MEEKNSVLLVSQNLMFLPRIQMAASAAGLDAQWTRTAPEFENAFHQDQTAAVIVDLEGDEETWVAVLEALQSQDGDDATKIIAYGPHEDVIGQERARTLGCDPVLTKGQFSRDLQQLMRDVASVVSN